MITHQNNGQEFLILKVPEEYWSFHINDCGDVESYPKDGGGGIKPIGHHVYMPPGQWEIMGLGSELTEEQAGEVVEKFHSYTDFVYKDYGKQPGRIGFSSAIESLHSLIQSHNLTPGTALFIKRVK